MHASEVILHSKKVGARGRFDIFLDSEFLFKDAKNRQRLTPYPEASRVPRYGINQQWCH